jgi:hypothetical protein
MLRIDPYELERCYYMNPIVFNAVNAYGAIFLSSDYEVVGASDDEIEFTKKFLDDNDWRSLLLEIVMQQCIFGKAWIELISGDKSKKLMALNAVDPKSMDFRRDSFARIIYDKHGMPDSYFQYLSFMDAPDQVPGETFQQNPYGRTGRGIEIESSKMAVFPLYISSGQASGIGLIEPIYDVVKDSNTFRKGLAQSISRHGFPISVTYVGDEKHQPTTEEIDNVYQQIKNINERNELVMPYYYKTDILESKKSVQLSSHLSYYDDLIIAGMGVPMAYVMGAGEGLNKSTLDKQNLMFTRRIKMMQYNISEVTRATIFRRLASENGFDSVPKLIWEEVSLDDVESKAERLYNYIRYGVLTPSKELEDYIRKIEHLPGTGKDYQRPVGMDWREQNAVRKVERF